MNQLKFLIILFFLVVSSTGRGAVITFDTIWRKVSEESFAQAGARLKAQSVAASLERAQNHWLPKLYLDARSYKTNDPGNSFFGSLEQRKIETKDFSPNELNHPSSQTFMRGALGVDFALYEGGIKSAQVEMYRHLALAEKLNSSQIEIDQYAKTALAYASISSLQKQRKKLLALSSELTKLINEYKLGQKANPVGYSGLLGMKSLLNRIAALNEQFSAEEKTYYGVLKEMGISENNWTPQALASQDFVDRYLSFNSELSQSYLTDVGIEMSKASYEAAKMERGRYLPRVAAFSESNIFHGKRDTANGYTIGIALQWSLFDSADYGKYNEARLNSLATEKFVQATLQKENSERLGLYESNKALRANLARLNDSDLLLTEQSNSSATLFRNGSINALQFVEMLNRRTDLIAEQLAAEINLIKIASEQVTKTKFEIGGEHK